MTKEDNSPALAKIVAELKNEVNQINGRVTRLEIMKPVDESFENRRIRRGSSNETNATKSKSTPPKPCLVREACAFDFKINSNSTVITPNGDQPTSCSDLSQLGYTLNGFYTVKSAGPANALTDPLGLQLETVFCAFKQPNDPYNSSTVEKRVGFLKLDPKTSSLSEITPSSSNNIANIDKSSSGRLILHLQIQSNKIIQNPGAPVVFDNIILNAEKGYDPNTMAFFAPFTGRYRFEFEAEVLEEKHVTFRYAGRVSPNYKRGWTLNETASSTFKNNVVNLMVTPTLKKATRIQLKSVGNTTDGTYTLSASYPTSFKGYLLH